MPLGAAGFSFGTARRTTVAKRKFLLAIGQSNSTAIGDAQSWEDDYLQIAVRSPVVNPPQYAEGSYTDTITLPYTFPGGPQTNRFGTGTKPSAWQTVNCKGRTVQALRFLTFYDPTPAGLNYATSINQKYPGVCQIMAGSTTQNLKTTQRWQASPQGIQITRRSTGQVYTITSSAAQTNSITVTPDVVPPPIENEEFSIQLRAGVNSPNASTVVLASMHGGLNDVGTALYGPWVTKELVNPTRTASTFHPCRLRVWDSPYRVGQAVVFQPWNITVPGGGGLSFTALNGSADLTLAATAQPYYPVGQAVEFVGVIPTPFVTGRSYYVVYNSGSVIRVSNTQGGSPIAATANSVGSPEVKQSLPNGIQPLTTYYISRRGVASETGPVASFGAVASADEDCLLFPSEHKLANNDIVRVDRNSPPFYTGVDYYVVVAGANKIKLSRYQETPFSPSGVIDITTSMVTGLQLVKQESSCEYFLRRPSTQTVASVDASANEITLAAGHYMTVGDTVQFSVSGGGSLPGGILSGVTYTIRSIGTAPLYRNISLNDIANPANPLDILSTGSGTITMTQVGGQEELMCDGSSLVGMYFTEQWRGSMTGLYIRCTSSQTNPSNVGVSRPMGDIYFDSANSRGVIELGQAFPQIPAVTDMFVIEPPTYAGSAIPFHKWAMWLPWCPFEGQAVSTGTFAVSVTSNVASVIGVGAPIELFKNTQIQFFGNQNVVNLTYPAHIGSTASVIAIDPSYPIGSGAYVGKYLKMGNGPAAGQVRKVVSNTTTAITLDSPLSATPNSFDTFQILTYFTHPAVENGKDYYVTAAIGNGFQFSDSYNGSPISGVIDGTVVMNCVLLPQKNKINPFPPGFNYPNHLTPVPGLYQPFDGPSFADQPRQGHYVSTAMKMHEYLGEVMYVLPFAVGGSSLSHQETIFAGPNGGAGSAWYDPDQQMSWSPGDSTNCFGRLCDVLDAAKIAFEKQGDTGECIGIVWAQGESDGAVEDRANRYYYMCTALKAAVRQAIKDRGLVSGSAHKIPWIQPKIRSAPWPYSDKINAAIEQMVEEDSYSRTCEVDDLDVMPDNIHYKGSGMSDLSQRIFEEWASIQRMGTSEVDICNLALANIGETAKVTSIDPPDGSAQASLCATFYPLARDSLLQMGYWSFAIKRKALVEVDNPRTEWQYAYAVPADASGIIAVMPPDASNDYIEYGMDVPQKFVVETDIHGKRVLYTNQKDAHARYNAKIVDTTLFSTIFTISLSWHLASMLAGPIIKGDVGAAEAKRCAQVASAYMMQAKTHDATTQAEIKPPHTPSWINWR